MGIMSRLDLNESSNQQLWGGKTHKQKLKDLKAAEGVIGVEYICLEERLNGKQLWAWLTTLLGIKSHT